MPNFQPDLAPVPTPQGPDGGPAFYVETYGCQMNSYDSQAICGLLEAAGFRRTAAADGADVILLNTCSVRDHAEQKIFSRIGELRVSRRRRAAAQPLIGVCGCMAERLGAELQKGPHKVDLVVGVDRYAELPALLRELGRLPGRDSAPLTGHRRDAHLVAPPEAYPVGNSHLVTIHKGCDYNCTYCIVPSTRGPQSEKDPGLIMAEIRAVVAAGGSEVTLLGQNVTAYRWGDLDFAALLERIAGIDGLQRIRFLTGHPRDMHRRLMDTVGRLGKVCPWLHVPLQSGSDRVLRRMKRLYTLADYLAMVDYARRTIPDVTFSSDFIVGFPGETEADFQATLDAVRLVRYDQVFSFKYSERPGVPAVKLGDDVPLQEKKARLSRLQAVQEESWRVTAAGCAGAVWSGVVEAPARNPDSAWLLRTANNRKVIVTGPRLQAGQTAPVRIGGHRNTTFFGEICP